MKDPSVLGDRVQGSNLLLPSLLVGQGSHLRTSKNHAADVLRAGTPRLRPTAHLQERNISTQSWRTLGTSSVACTGSAK